jgi:hypothetical protein
VARFRLRGDAVAPVLLKFDLRRLTILPNLAAMYAAQVARSIT